jgi:hypothetical protein
MATRLLTADGAVGPLREQVFALSPLRVGGGLSVGHGVGAATAAAAGPCCCDAGHGRHTALAAAAAAVAVAVIRHPGLLVVSSGVIIESLRVSDVSVTILITVQLYPCLVSSARRGVVCGLATSNPTKSRIRHTAYGIRCTGRLLATKYMLRL